MRVDAARLLAAVATEVSCLDCDLERCPGPEPSGCNRCLGDTAGVGRSGFAVATAWRGLERATPAQCGAGASRERAVRLLVSLGTRTSRRAKRRGVSSICVPSWAQVTLFLAPSHSTRQRFIDFGIGPERITHAPPGFDHRPFKRVVRTASSILRIGFLGSLMVSKAPHLLLEAFRHLPPDAATLELVGAPAPYHGDDSYGDCLRPLLDQSGVSLRGSVAHNAVPETLAAFDLLVMPSIWPETSGLVIQEAFLAGVPVRGVSNRWDPRSHH